MIKNKIIKFSFLLLLTGITIVIYFIFGQEKTPNMMGASIIFLFFSILIFALIYFNNYTMSKILKWINNVVLIIYVFFGIIFTLIMLYASPDNKVYLIESYIFIFSSFISLVSLYILIKKKWRALWPYSMNFSKIKLN